MSLTTRVLIALALGIAGGIAISMLGGPRLASLAFAIEPLGTMWVNAIRMTVIPLVVASLIVGVTSAPDGHTIGRVGRGALVLFLLTLFAAAVFPLLLAQPILSRFPLDAATTEALRASAAQAASAAAESTSRVPSFTQWAVDLVPPNPVKAAADGAMLPLIVFSLAFGLAVTRIDRARRDVVVRFAQGIADASLTLVRWILAVAPIGVFALALPLAVRMGTSAIGALAGFVVLIVVLTVLFTVLVLYPLAVIRGRVSLMTFARAVLPAQAVAFSARSSLAALPAMIECARDRLGLPKEITGFFLPLAASTYRVGGALGQTASVLFIAHLYGISLGASQMLTILFTVVAATFSVPGVPGGSIVALVPVLMAAGLPIEGVGILLGIDTIPDMFRTTANVTGDMAAAVVLGARGRDTSAVDAARARDDAA